MRERKIYFKMGKGEDGRLGFLAYVFNKWVILSIILLSSIFIGLFVRKVHIFLPSIFRFQGKFNLCLTHNHIKPLLHPYYEEIEREIEKERERERGREGRGGEGERERKKERKSGGGGAETGKAVKELKGILESCNV